MLSLPNKCTNTSVLSITFSLKLNMCPYNENTDSSANQQATIPKYLLILY